MTEVIDVGVKNDLVRADEVLLKSRGVSMVAVSEALRLPIAVDRAPGQQQQITHDEAEGCRRG